MAWRSWGLQQFVRASIAGRDRVYGRTAEDGKPKREFGPLTIAGRLLGCFAFPLLRTPAACRKSRKAIGHLDRPAQECATRNLCEDASQCAGNATAEHWAPTSLLRQHSALAIAARTACPVPSLCRASLSACRVVRMSRRVPICLSLYTASVCRSQKQSCRPSAVPTAGFGHREVVGSINDIVQ